MTQSLRRSDGAGPPDSVLNVAEVVLCREQRWQAQDEAKTPAGMSVTPNVRAKRATTAGRQGPVGENVPRTASPGPGGLPLALRLSEGLGLARRW